MRKFKIFIFFIFSFCLFLTYAGFANALELKYPSFTISGKTYSLNDSTKGMAGVVAYVYNFGIAIAFFIAIISVAIGGISYLVSLGMGKFPDEGKEQIKSGLLGLLLILCSYVIMYTINPALVFLRFDTLLPITHPCDAQTAEPSGNDTHGLFIQRLSGVLEQTFIGCATDFDAPGDETITFQEVPAGILVENLLTQNETSCYGFTTAGNPVEGDYIMTDKIKNGVDEDKDPVPGYKENVPSKRIKSPTYLGKDREFCLLQFIEAAKNKAVIMEKLSRTMDKLMSQCDCSGKCEPSTYCGGVCDQPKGCPEEGVEGQCTGACVDGECQQKMGPYGTADCCPDEVKDSLEHGPVLIDCPADSCGICGDVEQSEKQYKGLDEFRCDGNYTTIQGCSNIADIVEEKQRYRKKDIFTINMQKWSELSMAQQMIYFKEKIEKINNNIKQDKENLENAVKKLNSQECYLSNSYQSLLDKIEKSNPDQKNIDREIIFKNPSDNSYIDSSKYCRGFSYGNSQCYDKCSNECPDADSYAIRDYSLCGDCEQDDFVCLENRQQCMEDVFENRRCMFSNNPSQTFIGCVESCRSGCEIKCSLKYYSCSGEYQTCAEQCQDDSKCVMENKQECLINSEKFLDCAQDSTDPSNANYCLNNAYKCKYGSDLFPGSSDCIVISKECWGKYSSSLLYQNPWCQKCENIYEPAEKKSKCYSKKSPDTDCGEVCPETLKCPSASDCPSCKCGDVDLTINTTNDSVCPDSDWLTVYEHMSQIGVHLGQEVELGDVIGEVGNMANGNPYGANGAHLHFEVGMVGEVDPEDPYSYDTVVDINNYSTITAPGGTIGSRNIYVKGPEDDPENWNAREKGFVLESLISPLDKGWCEKHGGSWTNVLGSLEHKGPSYWAQDWSCQPNLDTSYSAPVYVMSGGGKVESIVDLVDPEWGAVIIRHRCKKEYVPSGPCPGGTAMQTCPDGSESCNCPEPGPAEPGPSSCPCPENPSEQCDNPNYPNPCPGTESSGSSGSSGSGSESESEPEEESEEEIQPDTILSKRIIDFRVTGPNCASYAYDGDPLTFYCQKNWLYDSENQQNRIDPMGTQYIRLKEDEIPVGQTLDSAIAWGEAFTLFVDKIILDADTAIKAVLKSGNAWKTSPVSEYCKCGAKMESGSPVCSTGCDFFKKSVGIIDEQGGQVLDEQGSPVTVDVCSCEFTPCTGNPCKQMLTYSDEFNASAKKLKQDYLDYFESYLKDARSDVYKALSYTRKKAQDCALVASSFGKEAGIMSCSRVQDELIPLDVPEKMETLEREIKDYCYGQYFGRLFGKNLSDSWFCVEKRQETNQLNKIQ